MDYAKVAREAHCLDTAVDDVTRRLEARFQGEAPSPGAVQTWLTQTLRQDAPHLFPQAQTVWAKLGMSEETFNTMPAAWKLEQGHLQQPTIETPHARRPAYRDLTPQELAALDAEGLPWAARREKARTMQQSPPPQHG